jgi:hypothetical protein
MPHFEKLIDTVNGVARFYFNRIYSAEGVRYHISFIDADKKVHMFLMQENGQGWFLLQKQNLPSWVSEKEEELESIIVTHLAENGKGDLPNKK